MKGINKIHLLKELFSKNGLKLIFLMITNPIKMILTYHATNKTLWYCTKKFGTKHFGEGVENAFRHGLWSIYVIKYINKFYKFNTAINWKIKFSSYYENCFFSNEISKEMDEHNNAVGIEWISNYYNNFNKIPSNETIEKYLLEKMKSCVISVDKNKWDKNEFCAKV